MNLTTSELAQGPCANCLRHGNCLGAEMAAAAPAACASGISVLNLARGQTLHRSGETLPALYVVQSGALKSRRHSLQGEEEILAFRLPGDTIGVDAIGSGSSDTEAVALCASRVCRLPLETLHERARASQSVARHLFDDIGHEFGRLHQRLQYERLSAPARLASFLIAQLERRRRLFGVQNDSFSLPMTRIDLGRFLGMATETVSRIFTRLQNEGIVASDGNLLRIVKLAALQALAQDGAAQPTLKAA